MRGARPPRLAPGPGGADRVHGPGRRRGVVRSAGASARAPARAPWSRRLASPRGGRARLVAGVGAQPRTSDLVRPAERVDGAPRAWGRGPGRGPSRPAHRLRARLHLDPAGSWNALDLGFSANEHREAPVCCRPLVELLASLGLQAFPVRKSRGGFSYRLWTPAALPGALAAFSGKGRFVHALGAFEVRTGRTGANTTLRRASPLEVLVPAHRPTSEGKP